jgi:hypothetical protein
MSNVTVPTETTSSTNASSKTTEITIKDFESTSNPPLTLSTSSEETNNVCCALHCIQRIHKYKTSSPLLEICFYLIFLVALVLYSVDLGNSSQNYWFTSRIEELLAKEEWGMPVKTYMDIAEREEWWDFIQGKFYESMFSSYDGLPLKSKQRAGRLWDGNFVFHSVNFNQIRVKTYEIGHEECQIPIWLYSDADMSDAITERGCRHPFTFNSFMTSDFLPRNGTTTKGIEKCFQFNDKPASSWPFDGKVYSSFYPLTGHSCRLNTTRAGVLEAQNWLEKLKE